MRKELGPMMRLAAPLALTELGWMLMGIVDTIMAGRLNAAAVGAGSLGNMLFYPIAISGTGRAPTPPRRARCRVMPGSSHRL